MEEKEREREREKNRDREGEKGIEIENETVKDYLMSNVNDKEEREKKVWIGENLLETSSGEGFEH